MTTPGHAHQPESSFTVPDGAKRRTALRLATTRIILLRLREQGFRDALEASGWTPRTPMIPCEWDTAFADVRHRYDLLQGDGHALALVPVLHPRTGADIRISCLFIGPDLSEGWCGLPADEPHPEMSMGDIIGALHDLTSIRVDAIDPDLRIRRLMEPA